MSIVGKAQILCAENNAKVEDHFVECTEMAEVGAGAQREVASFRLTRYACLLIAMCVNAKKQQALSALQYFSGKQKVAKGVDLYANTDIVFFSDPEGNLRVQLFFDGDTVWTTQKRIAEIFQVEVSTINYHLGEIFDSGELNRYSVIRKDRITAADGKDYETMLYNLDVIIAVVDKEVKQNTLIMNIFNKISNEERDARRSQLYPSFEDLMADWEKPDDEADYYHRDMGCGMLRFSNRSWGNKQIFIVNTSLKKVYPITKSTGELIIFTHDDIDWENVNQLEHNGNAKRLVAKYGGLSIGDYQDGLAYVSWMLYPDGRYFADEDGFGMEDNDEVNISAYIDTQCRVVVKFQEMKDEEKRRKLREEALSDLS